MYAMFMNCINLKELDLSNFNTSNVTNMQSMFYQCRRLEDLNLGSFDTSKLTTINYIFNNCISLKNLDIRNAELSKVQSKIVPYYGIKNTVTIYVKNSTEKEYMKSNISNAIEDNIIIING